MFIFCIFFFKQKTAYEMRISDWSSDVCSSDLGRGAAEGDALVEGHVVADLRGLADHHAHAVVDEEAAPDGGARMNLDAGQQARDGGNPPPDQEPAPAPEGVGQPVEDDRLETGIAKHHL